MNLLLLVLTLTVSSRKQERISSPPELEQSSFSMEDKTFTRGVSVPDAVLGMLRKDERVLSYLQAIDKTPQELTTEPFVAFEIHLSGSEEKDLIVMGTGGLLGANVTPFWVFRKRSSGYQLVLHVFAHDLKVENWGFR